MSEAVGIVRQYDAMTPEEFCKNVAVKWQKEELNTDDLSKDELALRNSLKEVFDLYYPPKGLDRKRELYLLDLQMGLKVYEILDPSKPPFTISDAADDDMWRFISVKIIPDLTYLRYPPKSEKEAKNINKKRFYSGKRRIWIKSLWWYIYLSWQGDRDSTYEVLKNNATDNINKLIETPGRGYRLSLYREMMLEYANREHKTGYFAGVTKLNNAKCKTIEPSLLFDGEKDYVSRLFDAVPVNLQSEDEDDVEE
jgi:hypothetical protein